MRKYGFFKKKYTSLIVVVCLPLILIFFLLPIFSHTIKSKGLDFFRPALKILSFFSPAKVIFRLENMFSPHTKLQNQIKILKAEVARLKEKDYQTQRLEELLGFKNTTTKPSVAAKVIARDYSNYRHTLLIDRGKNSGVKKGNCVVFQFGVVGKVIEVASTTSRVILMTDLDFRATCLIQRSREEGVLCGIMKDFCLIKYLPAEADVVVGDSVVTSGLGTSFPKGLLIGEVSHITESADGISAEVFVRPLAGLGKLEEVLVILE